MSSASHPSFPDGAVTLGGAAASFSAATISRELHSGDVMSRADFHRVYELAGPDIRAELIQGVVFVASPVGGWHASYHGVLATLLGTYHLRTAGTQMCCDATVLLAADNEVQPDLLLRILPECGGKSRLSSDGYLEGPPEFVVEVAHSSRSMDLNTKHRIYRDHGVAEYLVASISEGRLRWFDLRTDAELPLPDDGIIRVCSFPGLWIPSEAFFAIDGETLMNTLNAGLASPEHAAFVERLSAIRDKSSGQSPPALA
jgi:Uma2 family endonuclease